MTDEHKDEHTVGDTLGEMGEASKKDAAQTAEDVEEAVTPDDEEDEEKVDDSEEVA